MRRSHRGHDARFWAAVRTPYLILSLVALLSVIGLVFVFEASSIRALSETGNSLYYFLLQARWMGIGTVALIFFSLFPYRSLRFFAVPFMAVVTLLLIAVLVPSIGQSVGGARRWIDLGFMSIQPTEFVKLATIIYLSTWFTSSQRKRFVPFVFLMSSLVFLVLLQPDMGTAIIIFVLGIGMYYLAGKELRYLLLLLPLSCISAVVLIFIAPYRLRRLTAFLDPSKDPTGIGYHINQILISLAQGGLLGRGFGASRQKYLYLPEAHTDSIFAIIGEEMGFVGACVLIAIYISFLFKLFHVYERVNDPFGKLLVGGTFVFFGFQIIANLAGMTGLMPLTGVPLPFISYGGSHILISFILIGIVVNVARTEQI